MRDALHRLAGERLVDAMRHDGFWVPIVTEAGLRDLYDWNQQILALALRAGAAQQGVVGQTENDGPEADAAARLFLRVAQRSPNREHERVIGSVNERLSLARRFESQFLRDGLDELIAIEQDLVAGTLEAVRRRLAAYHRERRRIVPALTAEIMAGHRRVS